MRWIASAALAFALAGSASAAPGEIDVLTQNQYLGADLGPLLAAAAGGDPAQVGAALGATLARMSANNFPVRAQALAEQICDRQPHVAGLQEVFRFSIGGVSGPPAPLPFVDHLVELMAAIDDRCANYVVAASLQNADVAQAVPGFGVVRFTDRDVVLVRDDVPFAPVPFAGSVCAPTLSGVPGLPGSGCHFQAVVPLPPAFGGSILRGYVGVDAWVGGVPYRVVNTHLEVQRPDGSDFSSVFQALQAAELIAVLAGFPALPGTRVIALGDINSSPEDPILPQPIQPPPFPLPPPFATTIVPPYTQFVAAGYADAWDARPGKPKGFTCCHDEDLSVGDAEPDERIDVVFSATPLARSKANVIGGDPSDRVLGLWPSDHDSLIARLRF